MLQLLVIIALAAASVALPRSAETDQPPVPAPAPRVSAAHVEGDNLYLVDVTTVFVPVQTKVKIKEGNKDCEKIVTEYRPVFEMRTSRYVLRDIQAFGTDGKPIDPKSLPDHLKKRVPVLLSADRQPVHPFYRHIIKDGALILVLPPPNAAAPGERQPTRALAPGPVRQGS